MGELERSQDITPEFLAVFGMISPERSQVLRAYFQDVDDRRRRRAAEFGEELLNVTQRTLEEILQRILDDERTGELFERGVQEALLTADERKRRLLARAVASGVLATDEAEIDDAQTIARAIAAIEAAHVRVLLVLARQAPGQLAWGTDYVAAEMNASSGLAEALLAKLPAEGLAGDATEFTPMGPRGGPRWEISDLGRRVLELLRSDPPS